MPYVESDSTMSSAPMTNGEPSPSLFLSHLKTYPVVTDAVNTYKTNPYGAKSLDLVRLIYVKLAVPFLPYLRTPYSIVAPYVSKADSLADTGLTKVDERFPVVKEDTEKLKGTVVDYAKYPLTFAGQGKEYLFSTYDDEYKKTGGEDGIVHTAKAIVSTELKLAFDAYGYLASFVTKKKGAVKEKVNEK